MLHGYPGIEQNLDIAQLLRMAGYAVVHFSYRGVWESHGYYRFSHLGAIIMAPCDMAHKYLYDRPSFDKLMSSQDQGYFNTPSRNYIEDEVRERAEGWLFVNAAQRLDAGIPYRFIGGALDKATPPDAHILPVLEALTVRGLIFSIRRFAKGTLSQRLVCG